MYYPKGTYNDSLNTFRFVTTIFFLVLFICTLVAFIIYIFNILFREIAFQKDVMY